MAEFSDEAVNDPRVTSLRDCVSTTVDEGIDEAKAVVVERLKGGRRVEKVVNQAVGSLERPLSDQALEAKVHALADPILGKETVEEMIQVCREVIGLSDAADLARAATPTADTIE